MQLLFIVSPEKLPGWQEVEGRRKVCNHQVIWSINNFDVGDVNASDRKDQTCFRICVSLMKEDRGCGEGCFLSHLYFVCLETNGIFESQTITVLSHSYLECLSGGSFLTRWFIWGKLKDTNCLAWFHGYCFMCLEDWKCLSFQLWAMGCQLDHLSLLSFFLKICIFPPLLRCFPSMMSHRSWSLTSTLRCIAQRAMRWSSPLNTFLLLMRTVMTWNWCLWFLEDLSMGWWGKAESRWITSLREMLS